MSIRNSVIFVLICFTCVACSSQPSERKPFMIVGKVDNPIKIYTALNLGFNIGNSNLDNNKLNTKFDSFTKVELYPNLYSIYHSAIGSFRLGDKYSFNWYKHIRYADDEVTVIEKESFMGRDHSPYFGYSKTFYCPNRVSCFVFEVNYLPRIRKSLNRFSSVNQISNRRLYGQGIEAYINAYTGLINVGLAYKKEDYGDELKIQSISFNTSFFLPLF